MRLWSLHPAWLDSKGLVALWREGLLAQKVLLGETRGYKFHPQLKRFQATKNPVAATGQYLAAVAEEAAARGYLFDASKIARRNSSIAIAVTRGQLEFRAATLDAKTEGSRSGEGEQAADGENAAASDAARGHG